MDYAFILDPLPDLKAYKDSSVAMMRARATPLTLFPGDHDWYAAGAPEERSLKEFAAVMMRKDPPFDMEYLYSTYLLELAESEGERVFNRPRAIRDHNEKFAIS